MKTQEQKDIIKKSLLSEIITGLVATIVLMFFDYLIYEDFKFLNIKYLIFLFVMGFVFFFLSKRKLTAKKN